MELAVMVTMMIVIFIVATIASTTIVRTIFTLVHVIIAIRKHGYDRKLLEQEGLTTGVVTILIGWNKANKLTKVLAAVPVIGLILVSAYVIYMLMYGTITWPVFIAVIMFQAMVWTLCKLLHI